MRKSEVLLTLALLGSVSAAIGLWIELRAERALNAELTAPSNLSPGPATAAPKPVAPDPAAGLSRQAANTPAVATPASTNPLPAQMPSTVHGTQEEWDAYRRRLMQNPKYREAWRAQERLVYNKRRENVIRLLGFTPEQADAVVDLAIDQQLRSVDDPPPIANSMEDIQRLQAIQEQREREDQEKLLAVLGPEKLARFEEYMQTRASRMQVDEFRSQLPAADALRDDQVEPLIAALHVEDSRMRDEMSEYRDRASAPGADPAAWEQYNDRVIDLKKAAYERMHSAAAPILSSAQLEKLDAVLKRDLDRHEAQARIQRLQSKIDGGQTAKAD